MAGERTLPGRGLYAGWTSGTNGYAPQINENFRKLSAICQGAVASRTTEPPLSGTPSPGDEGLVYILPSGSAGTDGNIALYDEDLDTAAPGWISIPPEDGWLFYVVDEDDYVVYLSGTGWRTLSTVIGSGGSSGVTVNAEVGPSYTALQLDFDSEALIYMNNVSANDVTIPAGITGTKPIHICQGGEGATSIVAASGVTINAADSALTLRTQFSVASLLPLAPDLYLLVGDLAVPTP